MNCPSRCHCSCKGAVAPKFTGRAQKIILMGHPNVGKSVIFNNLTGRYAVVSNYPGTTVEVARGRVRIGAGEFEVVDVPGMYSLVPISEEERVGRNIFIDEKDALVLHVVDAKNLERMLPFTLQLIETERRVMLVLNMMDELRACGDAVDFDLLERELRIPVVGVTALSGEGMDVLRGRIETYVGCTAPVA